MSGTGGGGYGHDTRLIPAFLPSFLPAAGVFLRRLAKDEARQLPCLDCDFRREYHKKRMAAEVGERYPAFA